MQHPKTPAALAITLLIGAIAAGCGSNTNNSSALPTSPAQPGYGAPATDPYNQTQYPTPGSAPATGTATPRPVPSVPPATGDATGSPAPTPTPTASATPIPNDFKLRLVSVQKKTSGIWLWKKAEITVQVQNPLFTRAQTGKVLVTYFYSGSIVGQPLSSGISLQPAEIKTFTFKATEKSDDATAQVTTDGQ
ncbi:MAG: hypothetical protein FJZ01_04055 [Candidatus Sericytochromatia bacterium]|nr:hypothetical protein [Candidatus Tanganyikabacteria bacterium]